MPGRVLSGILDSTRSFRRCSGRPQGGGAGHASSCMPCRERRARARRCSTGLNCLRMVSLALLNCDKSFSLTLAPQPLSRRTGAPYGIGAGGPRGHAPRWTKLLRVQPCKPQAATLRPVTHDNHRKSGRCP